MNIYLKKKLILCRIVPGIQYTSSHAHMYNDFYNGHLVPPTLPFS